MQDIIKTLFTENKYSEALELIESKLLDIVDIKMHEEEYSELLHLRVFAKFNLKEQDVIIRDQVRREVFPSETYHKVDNRCQIKLIYQSAFADKSNAYVNTVSIDNPFSGVTPRSASIEFIKRIGEGEIIKQIKKQRGKIGGDFIILEHDNLSAPMSYHILFYSKDIIDFQLLERGIINVLNDASKRSLKNLSFFPLGFDLVCIAGDNQAAQIAESIADKTAEIIVGYILGNKNKFIPQITFNFVTVLTMVTYQKAFSKWADYKKSYFTVMKQITEKQNKIIKATLTRDPEYIEQLKELTFAIDDENSILLLGETGVGKSFLSKKLHEYSVRRGNTFKEMNCAQITRELIYAQLFGAVKGSFTNANKDIVGAIEAAEGGVLFLDEIGYADIEVQRSLLKFLDEGKYTRLGEESKPKVAHVKLIFGTNIEMQMSIEKNTFAFDLFERIDKNVLTIPSLRQRKEDIPLLAAHFINILNDNSSFKIEVPKETIEVLQQYSWPGNIRQLNYYIGDIFRKARNNNVLVLTPGFVDSYPPRNKLYTKNPFQEFELSLLSILKSWDPVDGKLLEIIIKPMLSKLYIEDLKGLVKESAKTIGIDGSRGERCALTHYREKYSEIKDTFLK